MAYLKPKNFIAGLIFGASFFAGVSFAAFPPSTVPQGGTGNAVFEANSVLLGNGTGKLATSTFSSLFIPQFISNIASTTANWGGTWRTLTPQTLLTQGYNAQLGTVTMSSASTSAMAITGLTGILYGNGVTSPISVTTGAQLTSALSGLSPDFTNLTVDTATSSDRIYAGLFCNLNNQCRDIYDIFGTSVSFYPYNTSSDIAGYEDMYISPDGETPIDESCSADADIAGGYCLIDTYVSTTTDIVILNYPAGTTRMHAYTYVSNANGISYVVLDGYRRLSSGTEIWMGQATTTEVNQLTISESMASFTAGSDTPFSADGTDRLVMKVRGWTDSSSARVIHWTYQNTGYYSHIETPITQLDEGYATTYGNNIFTGNNTFNASTTFAGIVNAKYASTTAITSTDAYFTTIRSGLWNGSDIDISDYTNLTAILGLQLDGDTLQPAAGYEIPLSASTTEWYNFNLTPSSRITAGNFIDWSGNILNVTDSWYNSASDVIGGFTSCSGIQYLGADGACHDDTTAGLTGGTAGMLASWVNGTTLTATGTPTVANIVATSTASSTLPRLNTTGLKVSGFFNFFTETWASLADFGAWIKANTFTGGDHLTLTNGDFDVDDDFLLNTGDTGTGTYDFSGATLKVHKYPGFSFPPGAQTATTTTATTSVAIGTAYVANSFSGSECWSGNGTVQYQISDGTNKTTTKQATTTASRFVQDTNNTFTAGEKRFIEIGPMTASYLSCSFDIVEN